MLVKLEDLDLVLKEKDVNVMDRPPECITENHCSYFSTKTYVMGSQKKHLNETVLLSTQNTCLN